MNIDKAIHEFLNNEELSESSKPIYENVLMVFGGYFREYNCNLNNITCDDIFKSLDYYINERNIKFENTARFYIIAIKNFIVYCDSMLEIKNKELMNVFGLGNNSGGFENKVDIKIDSLIKSKVLKREKSGIEINNEELKKISIKCDEIINNFKIDDVKSNVYNKKYMRYIGALGLKIILYTGIKVGLTFDIKLNSILQEGYLRIDNIKKGKSFNVEIPQNLHSQLCNYKDNIRKELLLYKNNEDKTEEYLFIDYKLKPLKMVNKNKPFNDLIYELVGKNKEMGSATAIISKRSIIDMVSAGMSLKMIEDLTGYGDTVIQYCKEKSDQIKRKEKNPSEYINKYLKKRDKETGYYNVFFDEK